MNDNVLTLYELNELVRLGIQKMLPDSYWIIAELNEVRLATSGHCFIELVEKSNESSIPIAKARAVIWANIYNSLRLKFEDATGMSISVGIKVMIRVSVEFHELYGYSLNIIDIDPSYTMGDLYLRRLEILNQLKEDGVIDMNKSLDMPCAIQRVAVISSPVAAGYGDFKDQLQNNPYNIKFDICLFESIMQGKHIEDSVIRALNNIYDRIDDFDVVVIIRGGGAVSDLSGFETYNLAFHIAQFPLPVISGIGHERDRTVIDEISAVSVKTPTAAAQYIITRTYDFWLRLSSLGVNIGNNINSFMNKELVRYGNICSNLKLVVQSNVNNNNYNISLYSSLIQNMIKYKISSQHGKLSVYLEKLPRLSMRIDMCKNDLFSKVSMIDFNYHHFIDENKHKLDMFSNMISNIDPKRILERGFAIIRCNGKAVRSKFDIVDGPVYNLEVADGDIDVKVNKE